MKTFEAKVESLPLLLKYVSDSMKGAPILPILFKRIELACEETFMNILQHGYKNAPGVVQVKVNYTPQKSIEIVFKDQAPRFNPLEFHPIDKEASLDERKVGGLGIHLMKECSDRLTYQYEKGQNILTLLIFLQ